ncbi:MAG: capsule assembly Wzi family protein [Dysgonamonadaceae bacterium]|jgi:hypothetical protein|nr:capsule assembly Wzi family protein [Dysgonamonadaceae bacterium]
MRRVFIFLLLCFPRILPAQDTILYRAETFASIAAGDYTPFWITSNTFGVVPLKPNNAYLRGNALYTHSFYEKLQVEAGVDLLTAARHTSKVWANQLFAGASYKNIKIIVGTKNYYNSFLDRELSVGDMCFSSNARPIPEVLISIPEYITLPYTKKYLNFKGDFAVGKSMEDDYIIRTKNSTANYTTGVLYHHKSLFIKLAKPVAEAPFAFTAGLVHSAQWGGVYYGNTDVNKHPVGFDDFLRILMCSSGNSKAGIGDRINVLGNHLGTINARLDWKKEKFEAAIYKQHLFDDNSGLEYANWRDGIWGGEVHFSKFKYIEKVIVEYLNTTHQSGPLHFIDYDKRDKYRGGGADDYYNNYSYNGWSYFGRGIGNPLLTSPEYNQNGELKFKNTRVKSLHLGFKGKFSEEMTYRVLLTGMYGWGRMAVPFFERQDNVSVLVECNYSSEVWKGWIVGIQAATDNGSLYGNNYGCSLKIAYNRL